MPTKHKGTPKQTQVLNATICLLRATNSLQAMLAQRRAADDLTMSQFAVLEVLLHLGPLCQHALADKLLVSGANMTRVIDVLERRQLVERVRRAEDRRYITIQLTADGERLIRSVFPRHLDDLVAAFDALTGEERKTLRSICRKLGTHINERTTT